MCVTVVHVYSARCVYMSSIMRPLWVTHTHIHTHKVVAFLAHACLGALVCHIH